MGTEGEEKGNKKVKKRGAGSRKKKLNTLF
jgi:hypothetical protein